MPKSDLRILIIDDDADIRTSAELFLGLYFHQITSLEHPSQLQEFLKNNRVDVILLDMNYQKGANTGKEGMYWLRFIREINDQVEILLMTAYANIQLAVNGLKAGAVDYVIKPWNNQELLNAIRSIEPLRVQQKQVNHKQESSERQGLLIGKSECMQRLVHTIEKVAVTDANVLILGENGTGKQVAAEMIHRISSRNKQPFVHVDLGALSGQLFESELFGYKKGAFTDAKQDKAGRIEEAKEGTLFLDEIGNLELSLQSKLLSAIQNRTIYPVGSNQSIQWNARLICATNTNLEQAVNNDQFRQDLLFRINTIELHIPPLRERGEDIIRLAKHFLQRYSQKYQKPTTRLDESAINALLNYTWPGNVRELQHSIERAVILSDTDCIFSKDLKLQFTNSSNELQQLETLNLNEMEKKLIIQAIEQSKGNISKAAKELGITRTALYRRIDKYDI